MNDVITEHVIDPAVEALRRARLRPAVLKLQVAKVRSHDAKAAILAFEGDDDKIVYSQWVRRIRPNLTYLPFPCGGKDQLLGLLDSIRNDKTGIAEGIYFFVDRDFDDLKGRNPGPELFMTASYSVENYLVESGVLDNLLQIEFHCHASPEIRERVRALFEKVYAEFLEVTTPINARLYFARSHDIPTCTITPKISKIASISLESVRPGSETAETIIRFSEDPPLDLGEGDDREFAQLDPRTRYRGKFAYQFFTKWLRLLTEQADLPDRGVFAGLDSRSAVRASEITLNAIASKSALPEGLAEFVAAIDGPAPDRHQAG